MAPPYPNGEEASVPASEDASKHLRVAVVAPPWISIPPDGYGGIEAMVYWLVEGLVARGHEVTLIGAGDCRTGAARFLQTYEDPPMARMGTPFPEIVHALQADEHLAALDLDVVHDHSMGGPLTALARRVPTVLTAHGPVEGELGECYRLLSRHHPMVAISESQRAKGPTCPGRPRCTTPSRWTSTRSRPTRTTSCCSSAGSAPRRAPTWPSRRPGPPGGGSWSRPSATSRPSTPTSRSGCGPCSAPTPSGTATPAPMRRRSCWPRRARWSSRSSGTSRSGS